jgi:hypothetical protein
MTKKKKLFIQKLNEADRTEIEIITKDQSNNSLWFKERRLRITASNFGTYAKCDRVLSVRKKSIVCYTHQIQKQSN